MVNSPNTKQGTVGIREIIKDRRRKKQEAKQAYYFCSGVIIGIVAVLFLQGIIK